MVSSEARRHRGRPVLDNEDRLGVSVAGLGDVNGDGIGDLAAGANGDDDGQPFTGAVWIIPLNADGTPVAQQWTKISATAGGFDGTLSQSDHFGSSLVALGDLDGDGIGELAVGASGDDDGGDEGCATPINCNRGAVWVLFLSPDATVEAEQKISTVHGNFAAGCNCCVLDHGAGCDDADCESVVCAVDPFCCDAIWDALCAVEAETLCGCCEPALDVFDQFGQACSSPGDLNGGGLDDLVVGAEDDDGGPNRGGVWVLFLDDTPGDGDGGDVPATSPVAALILGLVLLAASAALRRRISFRGIASR